MDDPSRLHDEIADASTTEGLPVAPSLGPALAAEDVGARPALVRPRTLWLCALAMVVAVAAALVARALVALIDFFTNLAFFGRLSSSRAAPRARSSAC